MVPKPAASSPVVTGSTWATIWLACSIRRIYSQQCLRNLSSHPNSLLHLPPGAEPERPHCSAGSGLLWGAVLPAVRLCVENLLTPVAPRCLLLCGAVQVWFAVKLLDTLGQHKTARRLKYGHMAWAIQNSSKTDRHLFFGSKHLRQLENLLDPMDAGRQGDSTCT